MNDERNRQLVADLAAEWGTIHLLLDGEDVVLAGQLDELQQAVALAKDPDDVDDLVFDLLDLLEETPAAEYVRRVLGRSSDLDDAKLKSAAAVDGAVEVVEGISDRADHRALAAEMSLKLQPLTMMLHFGTNRAGPHNKFTTDVGNRLRFGSLVVTIPVVALETAKADAGTRDHWWNPFDNPDPKRHITSAAPSELDRPEQLLSSLQAAGERGASNEILVAVHGFNVRFDEAARGVAQFSFNTEFKGQTTFFAWPSLGNLLRYCADEDRAESAAGAFIEFIEILQRQYDKVHVLAHSMGNRVVLNALERRVLAADRLGSVAWVAPDVSRLKFTDSFPNFASDPDRNTLYASRKDKALKLSSAMKSPRIGRIDEDGKPFMLDGLETVDTSNVASGILSLEHSPHMNKRPVMTDLQMLLNNGSAASDRETVRKSPKGDWWFFP